MSKEWFHFCLMDKSLGILYEGQVDNNPEAIFKFQTELMTLLDLDELKDIILCMEHTGIYVQHLVRCWLIKGARLSLIAATKISESLGGQRSFEEKTDALDARRIAEYGVRFSDKLILRQAKSPTIDLLRGLQRQRDRLIKVITLLKVPINESQSFDSQSIYEQLAANQEESLAALKSDLKGIERQLKDLIEEDEDLKQLFKLVQSVEGIGEVTAREIIIVTEGFVRFSPEQAKKFARFSGLVPIKHRSGKSVRKKDRTSKKVHKKMKELLTMGARSIIKTNTELSKYYHRKRGEGKKYRVVINAMRNKMILRVFSVVRNQVMYQKKLNICLDLP